MIFLRYTKAWNLRGIGPGDGSSALFREEAVPLPSLSDHDVLVKFHASSINYPELASKCIFLGGCSYRRDISLSSRTQLRMGLIPGAVRPLRRSRGQMLLEKIS